MNSWRKLGKSSGSVPRSGRMMFQPQSTDSSIALMRTSSVSPGSAPRTATGPVRMCGPSRGFTFSTISRCAGPMRATSPTSTAPPETVTTVTVSPESTVRRGGIFASKWPQ